jgi:hypothetical protein
VKRVSTFLALCLVLACAFVPGAAQAGRTVDSFCSKDGDYCTSVQRSNGKAFLILRTFAFSSNYKLCVEPPDGDRECGYFSLTKGKHGVFASRVDFRDNFFSHGKGRYKVSWYFEGKTRLGPALYFRVAADLP